MTIFIDASAIVAMIAREPEAGSFADRLKIEPDRITSATAMWESVRGIQSARGLSFEEARTIVSDFSRDARFRIVSIDADTANVALDAHARFGRGVHAAALNFGDCFAYACATIHGAALLFKGDDFALTDVPDAMLT